MKALSLLEEKAERIKDMSAVIKEYTDSSGNTISYERHETTIPVSSLEHGKKYRALCQGCPTYGKNLSCPPYSPEFLQYINGAATARVICLRLPTGHFHNLPDEAGYRTCFRQARSLLVDELLAYRGQGYTVAGSGACLECEPCAASNGNESCQKPEKRIYSLESLGVNVARLVKTCFDINLEWSASENTADFVCAVGAVFLLPY